MLSVSVAMEVGVKFLNAFYRAFVVRGGLAHGLQDFYGPTSRVAVLGHRTMDGSASGKDTLVYLATVDRTLQERKVDIISFDTAPLPDGSVQLVCHGTLFLRSCKWSIIHVFVLSPTQYRQNTYYISSEHLCFLSLTDEKTPEGVTLLDPRQVAAVLAENARRQQEAIERKKIEKEAAFELEQELLRKKQEKLAQEERQKEAERQREEEQKKQEEQQDKIQPPAQRVRQMNEGIRGRERQYPANNNSNFHERRLGPQDGPDDSQRRSGAFHPHNTPADRLQGERSRRGRGRGDREPRQVAPNAIAESAGLEKQKRSQNFRQGNSGLSQKQENGAFENGIGAGSSQETAGVESREEKSDAFLKHRRERKNRKDMQKTAGEENKADGASVSPKTDGPPRPHREGPTKEIRITNFPTTLSDEVVREHLSQLDGGSSLLKVHRFGRGKTSIIAKFSSEEFVEKLCRNPSMEISGASCKVFRFYP